MAGSLYKASRQDKPGRLVAGVRAYSTVPAVNLSPLSPFEVCSNSGQLTKTCLKIDRFRFCVRRTEFSTRSRLGCYPERIVKFRVRESDNGLLHTGLSP